MALIFGLVATLSITAAGVLTVLGRYEQATIVTLMAIYCAIQEKNQL